MGPLLAQLEPSAFEYGVVESCPAEAEFKPSADIHVDVVSCRGR